MPDPFIVMQAMAAAAFAAAAILLGSAGWKRPGDAGRVAIGWPLAVGAGFLMGAVMLGQRPGLLPGTDKDRLLLLIVPGAMLTEAMLAASRPAPLWKWAIRLVVAALIAPILLHGSVYLAGPGAAGADSWTIGQRVLILGGIAMAMAAEELALTALPSRNGSVTVWAVLALTSVVAGMATMLSGYMSAGLVALPLAAVCGTGAVVGWFLRSHTSDGGIAVCLACLGSILVMGRFFGALSTMHALLLAGAPLFCWLGESRWLRTQIASGGARGHDL